MKRLFHYVPFEWEGESSRSLFPISAKKLGQEDPTALLHRGGFGGLGEGLLTL